MTIKIRRAKTADTAAIVELGNSFWMQTGYFKAGVAYDTDHCVELAEALRVHGISQVAYDGDRLVGLFLGVIGAIPFSPTTQSATEMVFYVDPDYRKSGLGGKIVKQAENVCRQLGVTYLNMIHLDSVDPVKAEGLYNKMGYHKSETVFTKAV